MTTTAHPEITTRNLSLSEIPDSRDVAGHQVMPRDLLIEVDGKPAGYAMTGRRCLVIDLHGEIKSNGTNVQAAVEGFRRGTGGNRSWEIVASSPISCAVHSQCCQWVTYGDGSQDHLTPDAPATRVVHVEVRSVWGNDLVYPACEDSRQFAKLTGTKTFTRTHIDTITALGYRVRVDADNSLPWDR